MATAGCAGGAMYEGVLFSWTGVAGWDEKNVFELELTIGLVV